MSAETYKGILEINGQQVIDRRFTIIRREESDIFFCPVDVLVSKTNGVYKVEGKVDYADLRNNPHYDYKENLIEAVKKAVSEGKDKELKVGTVSVYHASKLFPNEVVVPAVIDLNEE